MMSQGEDDDNIDNSLSKENSQPLFCLKILLSSLQIFPRNKWVFSLVFALATFPLSYLLFSLSLSAIPIKANIRHLEALVLDVPTNIEALHIAEEWRDHAVYLLRLKFLYFLPSYFLSLIAAVTTVKCTHSAVSGRPFSPGTAVTSFMQTWKRPLLTSFCVFAVLALYSLAALSLEATLGGSVGHTLSIRALASGLEAYVAAVTGLGLVVSILENRLAFEAIGVAWDLMEGRRVAWWVLSGWFVLVSGLIGRRWEKLMETMNGQDQGEGKSWTAVMGRWENLGLICLYGIEVIWGYVATTVLYCECTKRHAVRIQNDIDVTIV